MAAKAYLEQYLECEPTVSLLHSMFLFTGTFLTAGIDSMPLELQRLISQLREMDYQTQRESVNSWPGELACTCDHCLCCSAPAQATSSERAVRPADRGPRGLDSRAAALVRPAAQADALREGTGE